MFDHCTTIDQLESAYAKASDALWDRREQLGARYMGLRRIMEQRAREACDRIDPRVTKAPEGWESV